MSMILKWIFKTVVGRWVTGILVASLLGGAALYWHNFKQDLREEGAQECIQVINEETHRQMVDALAQAETANAQLRAEAVATALVNAEAKDRAKRAESIIEKMEAAREAQAENDDAYKEWADTPLPGGVADRLRSLRPGSDPDTG